MEPTQIVGPIVLFLLMSIVGMELTIADFRRVAAKPTAIVGGTVAQIVFLPLMTWAIVWLFGLDPAFGAGAVLVAVSPGAGISNILTSVARANPALSVTLTGVASVLSVVTLPLVASVGMRLFLDAPTDVEVPVASLVGQLLFMLLLPISLGMWLRANRPETADRLGPRLQRVVLVVMVVGVTLGSLFADVEQLEVSTTLTPWLAAGSWTLAAMAIGWCTAVALGCDEADRFTFMIEFSARNIAVSAIVALSGLGRLDLTFFSGVYMGIGYPMAFAASLWRRRRMPDPAGDA